MGNMNKRRKKKENNYIKRLFTRILLSVILLLLSIIFIKYSDKNASFYKKTIFTKNISFTKINKLYQKYLGNILPFDKIVKEETKIVFNETLKYSKKNNYKNGVELTVKNNYLTPVIESGIVVFIGEKDDYGKTIIIQGINGIDYWYGNITNESVKLYDYVEKKSLLGESKTDKLYIVLQKDGQYVKFDDYIK